jgi:hypothetical protein
MQVLYPHCAGLDIHQDSVKRCSQEVCIRAGIRECVRTQENEESRRRAHGGPFKPSFGLNGLASSTEAVVVSHTMRPKAGRIVWGTLPSLLLIFQHRSSFLMSSAKVELRFRQIQTTDLVGFPW